MSTIAAHPTSRRETDRWLTAVLSVLAVFLLVTLYGEVRVLQTQGRIIIPEMILAALTLALAGGLALRPMRALFAANFLAMVITAIGEWPHHVPLITSPMLEQRVFGVTHIFLIAAAVVVTAAATWRWKAASTR